MERKMSIPLSKVIITEGMRKAAIEALDSGWYILGERVREFEQKFAEFCDVKHAVSTSSGTTALFLTLLAYDIKPGDEVMIPSFSFIATATPILYLKAKPVFVDIDPRTYNIDTNEIAQKLTKKTKAIMPVHLYGHSADMDPIMEIADENDLVVIEDACQAHGATYKGRATGRLSHAACFSFYPSKNMTVCGDGGIVTTDNKEIADKIRILRDHGRTEKYVHNIIGYNMRFNEIQAAIGTKQLESLSSWIEARRGNAEKYTKNLKDIVSVPIEKQWAKHVFYMYVIRTQRRDELQYYLKNQGISTGIHYPLPIHMQPVIQDNFGSQPTLENTERYANEVLSLPMFPQLSQSEIDYICDQIINFYHN